MPFDSPLKRQQFDDLKKAERIAHDTIELCDRAGNCGMDVGQYREVIQHQLERAQQFKDNFFNPPPK